MDTSPHDNITGGGKSQFLSFEMEQTHYVFDLEGQLLTQPLLKLAVLWVPRQSVKV